jgi:hypothetical protein
LSFNSASSATAAEGVIKMVLGKKRHVMLLAA